MTEPFGVGREKRNRFDVHRRIMIEGGRGKPRATRGANRLTSTDKTVLDTETTRDESLVERQKRLGSRGRGGGDHRGR